MDERIEIELEAARPKVLALARKFFRATRLDGDPEDVAQDVLLRLLEARRRGDPVRNAEAWAVTTTKNLCVSIWRKARKGQPLPLREDLLSDNNPSSRLEESEAGALVAKALVNIPGRTRYLLRLRASGLSLDEIAAVTGRPKGSVKTSISKARKELMNIVNHE
ncbi:MAG: sigma-70 family RNA polymerase sigma factor [Bacteroidales bacterium]|nr:sigma-70 family RNA polymerase sigma factor [Bacteroidales bacterium]